MSDLETDLTRRFRASAGALDPAPPAWDAVVDRAARQLRRRRRTLTVASVASAACVVIGLAVVTTGPGTPGPGGTPRATTVDPTAGPASTPAAGPTVTLAGTVAAPSPDAWSRLPDGPLAPRAQPLVVSTGTGVLVWGGYDGTRPFGDGAYYDARERVWHPLPPAPLAAGRGDAIGVWTGVEVVVVNGVDGDVRSAAFDPATRTWRALGDPPVDNAANASSKIVAVDGTVVLVSVAEDGRAPQDQVARLDDLASGRWRTVPSPPIALVSPVDLVAGGGDAYLVGTVPADTDACWTLHVLAYTPSTGTWRVVPADPVANRAETVTVWTGTELLLGGGGSCADGVASPTSSNAVDLYDPATGTWRSGTAAPDGFRAGYRFPDTWTGTSVVAFTESGALLLYNPTTDAWHRGPALNPPAPIAPFETPQALVGRSLVIAGGRITSGGEPCCDPFAGVYEYTLPAGF